MRTPRRGAALLAAVLSLALLASACGKDDKKDAGSTSTTADASVPKGGTLVIGAEQEPDCLDFISSCSGSTWGDYMVKEQTLPAPYVFERNSSGGYAYKWNELVLSEEPKLETTPVQKVTYKINPKAVWSDGVALTSTDFKYTWDQVANGADVYDKSGYDLIQGVDDSDPTTAVVTFKDGKTYGDWRGLFVGNYGVWPSHILQGKDRERGNEGRLRLLRRSVDDGRRRGWLGEDGPHHARAEPEVLGSEAQPRQGHLQGAGRYSGGVHRLQVGTGLRDLAATSARCGRPDQRRASGREQRHHFQDRQLRSAVAE